jgi:magnesium-protoporphyrin O-methyltransferase
MMTTRQCCAADEQFDPAIARRELRRFQRKGPGRATRQILDEVRRAPMPPRPTLIDVGGGIGAIHHLLLEEGFARALQVDASRAYLEIARAEAERRGHGLRVGFAHGDFREVAATIPPADVVTLDRVVCCDPDFAGLLRVAADHARHLVALSYPRDRWFTRWFVAVFNAFRRLRGDSFRAFVHPPAAMIAILEGRGLRRRWAGGTRIWSAEVFERPTTGTPA